MTSDADNIVRPVVPSWVAPTGLPDRGLVQRIGATVVPLVLVAVFLTYFARPVYGAKSKTPNIVMIMCDDMGWSDIGCYGGEVQTPNLDRLAAEGLRFTQFYNCAKCTTTRAAIVTGLHPRRKGALLKTNMVTTGEVLAAAGYQTSLSGKWHLGRGETSHPYRRGFNEYYGLLDGCCNFFNPSIPDPPYKGGRVRFFGHNDQRITEFPEDFYTTDAFTDHAIKQIQTAAAGDKPFFVHVCYTAPHYPLHAKPEDINKYIGRFNMGWEKMREQRYRRQIEMGLIDPAVWKLSDRDSRAYDWETANHDFEDLRMAVYAAMIDAMDQNIGRLLQTLKDVGADDNTVVFFLSDNGGCAEEPGGRDPKQRRPGPQNDYVAVGPAWGWAQNAPFKRYKSWVHEGGICTPMIARWPGVIRPNSISTQPGHIIDFMATFVELAEAEYPTKFNGHEIIPLEGQSLVPILRGETREPHATLAWEWSGNRAIRQGDWKLVWDGRIKAWELYNLKVDRTETHDLAGEHPDRVTQMSTDWLAWAEKTGAPGGKK
jgi:arylsulfatase